MESSAGALCMPPCFQPQQQEDPAMMSSLACPNIVAETAMNMTASRVHSMSFDNNSLRLFEDMEDPMISSDHGPNSSHNVDHHNNHTYGTLRWDSKGAPRIGSFSASRATPTVMAAAEPPGSVSPAAVVSCPRRLKPVLVTQEYDPHHSRPELVSVVRGRPQFKLPPAALLAPQKEVATATTTPLASTPARNPSLRNNSQEQHSSENDTKLVSRNRDDSNKKRVRKDGNHAFVQTPKTNSARSSVVIPASSDMRESDYSEDVNLGKSAVGAWALDPPPMRKQAWSGTPAEEFKVRGPTYLLNAVKIVSDPSVMQCFAVDLVLVKEPLFKTGLSKQSNERIQRALARERSTGVPELPAFVFMVNLLFPAATSGFYHFVAYFGTNDIDVLNDTATPFGRLAKPFFFGNDDEFRNQVFKLIPRVAEGNFVVRKAVGAKPTLLARKLKHNYIRETRFMEVVVDISTSPVVNRVVKLALGYARSLIVDLMFLLEGDTKETLPERILGGVRVEKIDFGKQDGRPPH